jgi:hypothetical protein
MFIMRDNSLRLNNYDCEPCFNVPICFRRINHMAVKNHLHSSSGVREFVSGTPTTGPRPSMVPGPTTAPGRTIVLGPLQYLD